jgi:hypothetical protein
MKPDLSRAQWRRSSYSGNTGNCIEVANLDGAIAVRDSNGPAGATLLLAPVGWRTFIEAVAAGSFNP